MELPENDPYSNEVDVIKVMLIQKSQELLRDRKINRHLVVLISASLVEDYSRKYRIESLEKVELAWVILPHILEYLKDHAGTSAISMNKDDFVQELEAFIDIGNSPNLVTNSHWVEKTCCFPCLRRQRRMSQ